MEIPKFINLEDIGELEMESYIRYRQVGLHKALIIERWWKTKPYFAALIQYCSLYYAMRNPSHQLWMVKAIVDILNGESYCLPKTMFIGIS